MAENAPSKIRVAIIGGGCAGLAAAWQLSRLPEYEIHVYEKSWRLGGKGASVRGADGRVLDHGLHVWLGFYENAFRMMRECYAEVEKRGWGPEADAPEKLAHGRIEEAFFAEPHVGVAPDPAYRGEWAVWSALFPPADGLPGMPLDEGTNPFTLANYLLRCLNLLKTLMLSMIGPSSPAEPGAPRPDQRSTSDEAINQKVTVDTTASITLLIERTASLLRAGSLTSAAVLLQAVTILEVWLRDLDYAPQAVDSAIHLAEAVVAQTRKLLRDFTTIDPQIRMKTELIDIVMTIAVGLFRDRVLFDDRGLDAINEFDYRAWLKKHGATKTALESRFLTGIYDLVFAYRDGDRDQPSLAAGVALRGALRMFFTYRGAMFWHMGSGMGDAVFAPLYKVLLEGRKLEGTKHASPVAFHFLHELTKATYDVSQHKKRYVKALEFTTHGNKAKLDKCSKAALDEFGCWPDTEECRFGEAMKEARKSEELRLEKHFDLVIFAMGVDDFKKVGADNLPEVGGGSTAPARWQKMCDAVKTVATKSAQVWLRNDTRSLGWYRDPGMITALGLSFSTWADMTHVLKTEQVRRGGRASALDQALSIAYFCDVLPESEIEKLQDDVRNAAATVRDELQNAAGSLGSSDPALVGTADDPRRRMLDRIQNLSIPREFRGPIDVVLNQSLKEIANEGPDISPQRLADRLHAASDVLEEEWVINASLKAALESKVGHDLSKLIAKEIRPIWPAAFEGGSNPASWVLASHVQANVEASDRYTLSLPMSTSFRISPLDRSVENMTIAGDWTACGLDAGCVEAAVMSGMLAAYAISGQPDPKTSIIGYDHP
jgi:uncharacterized protein with NAD-binding domain and iron-sulfur cluster